MKSHNFLINSNGLTGTVAMLVIAFVLFGTAQEAFSQRADITIEPAGPSASSDAIIQAFSEAESIFNDGLVTMNETSLRRAAQKYEIIIQNFPNDDRHFDAYFSSVYIHMEYLQGTTDYEHARNLLKLLINNYPSNSKEVADAHFTLAHLNYRCIRDYRAAQINLSTILNDQALAAQLGSREIEVKELLAKCRQKLGEHDNALRIWEELEFVSPGIDSEGRFRWIQNSFNWLQFNDGRIHLYFEESIERDIYVDVLTELHVGLAIAESTWRLLPDDSLDVYLYKSADQLFDYTDRSHGFALSVDHEIHISPSDLNGIEHLAGVIVSQRLNTRPEGTIFPFLRAGFNSYFMGTRDELDRMAALEIYYYGGSIERTDLLFPLSFDYTYSEEYRAMAASFMHYLLEESHADVDGLEKFYRLWANPTERIEPPVFNMVQMWLSQLQSQVVEWQDTLIPPEHIFELFEQKLGLSLPDEFENWQQSLEYEIQQIETEFGSLSADVIYVTIDLSTPEKALETWWNAYRSGDFNAMIQASTRDMAGFLQEAMIYYEEEGILDQVIIEHFIHPYRSARMVVVQTGSFADDLYVYEVEIEKGDDTEEMTIVVRREGGLWKVDSN